MHEHFPLPDPEFLPLAPFWEAAAKKELRLPFDEEAGSFEWYPNPNKEYVWKQVSGKGTLFSWVNITHAFLPQYKSALPFTAGLVTIAENPSIRLVTRIVGPENTPLNPSDLVGAMEVEVVFGELSYQSHSIVAPFFCPA